LGEHKEAGHARAPGRASWGADAPARQRCAAAPVGRPLPDGRLYYLLHVKPSKFGRARVIPIGDQLGRAVAEIIQYVRAFYRSCEVPACDRRDEHEKRPLPRVPYLLQGRSYPARSIRIPARSIRTRSAGGCGRLRAPQQPHPVRVIQALLGHTTVTTCDDLRELHPSELVESYRRSAASAPTFYGPAATSPPSAEDWAAFAAGCSLRDMGTPRLRAADRRTLPARAGLPRLQPRPAGRRARCPLSGACSPATAGHSTAPAKSVNLPDRWPPVSSRSHGSAAPCNGRRRLSDDAAGALKAAAC